MLHSLELENFKAFGTRVKIPCAPITLIFGPNSSGKSSILQALHLMKQTYDHCEKPGGLTLQGEGCIVDLGSFRELVHDHKPQREVRIKLATTYENGSPSALEWTYQVPVGRSRESLSSLTVFVDGESHPFTVIYDIRQGTSKQRDRRKTQQLSRPPGLVAHCRTLITPPQQWEAYARTFFESRGQFEKCIDDHLERTKSDTGAEIFFPTLPRIKRRTALRLLRRLKSEISCTTSPENTLHWISSLARGYKVPLSSFLLDSKVRKDTSQVFDLFLALLADVSLDSRPLYAGWWRRIDSLQDAVGKLLDRVSPMGPFRRTPQRWYQVPDVMPVHVGLHGENFPYLLFHNPALLSETNKWLEVLDMRYSLDIQQIGDGDLHLVEVRLSRRRPRQNDALADVGFGVTQILPILVESLNATGRIITIEQPEVHIHPKLQADLGDLLIHSIKKEDANQFIIETHSEHLILRLLRRIRETTEGTLPKGAEPLKPEDLSVLYVKRGKEGSEVVQLPVTPDGDFAQPWPDGFFAERAKELF
ncbi:MAG: DUF3696 domain-containing protein [Candidatus Omnitrophica bacterium]|nr:DUF3696 domain-containing protein [Candidatus Omnitrophota bacterium]